MYPLRWLLNSLKTIYRVLHGVHTYLGSEEWARDLLENSRSQEELSKVQLQRGVFVLFAVDVTYYLLGIPMYSLMFLFVLAGLTGITAGLYNRYRGKNSIPHANDYGV